MVLKLIASKEQLQKFTCQYYMLNLAISKEKSSKVFIVKFCFCLCDLHNNYATDRKILSNFGRGLSKDNSCQVWLKPRARPLGKQVMQI